MVRTGNYSEEEIGNLCTEYLGDLSFNLVCAHKEGSDEAVPMLRLTWTGLVEDSETGLSILLDMLKNSDVTDSEKIREIVDREKANYDLSRTSDPFTLAQYLSGQYINDNLAYRMLYEGQDFYLFLEEVSKGLTGEPGYGEGLSERLSEVREKLLTKDKLIFALAGPEESLEDIKETAKEMLSELPEGSGERAELVFPEKLHKMGVEIESPDQYTVLYGDMMTDDDTKGRYIPFITAMSDLYLIPVVRFQNGAYSAGSNVNAYTGYMALYSYSDPYASETVDLIENIGETLKNTDIPEENFDGYILNSIGYVGEVSGVLKKPIDAIDKEITGYDAGKTVELINDIKNADLEDKEAAAEWLSRITASAGICTVGNADVPEADASGYDKVISYRAETQ